MKNPIEKLPLRSQLGNANALNVIADIIDAILYLDYRIKEIEQRLASPGAILSEDK